MSLTGFADAQLEQSAKGTTSVYIYELFATVATMYKIRSTPIGKRITLVVDNEAAAAVATIGAPKSNAALRLLYSIWSAVASHELSAWP